MGSEAALDHAYREAAHITRFSRDQEEEEFMADAQIHPSQMLLELYGGLSVVRSTMERQEKMADETRHELLKHIEELGHRLESVDEKLGKRISGLQQCIQKHRNDITWIKAVAWTASIVGAGGWALFVGVAEKWWAM